MIIFAPGPKLPTWFFVCFSPRERNYFAADKLHWVLDESCSSRCGGKPTIDQLTQVDHILLIWVFTWSLSCLEIYAALENHILVRHKLHNYWREKCSLSFNQHFSIKYFLQNDILRDITLTLMLLVANLANTKWGKNPEKLVKPWNMGTHLRALNKSFPMNTNMTGIRWFSKIFASMCFGRK